MSRKRQKGSAIVETALMMPWLAFIFVGVLDFGFYSYACICTQNAARAGSGGKVKSRPEKRGAGLYFKINTCRKPLQVLILNHLHEH